MKNDPTNGDFAVAGCWNDCPPGQLIALAQRLDASDQRQHRTGIIAGFSITGLLLLGIGAVVYWHRQSPEQGSVATMTCLECRQYFNSYHDHLILHQSKMSAEAIRRMEDHLRHCPRCRAALAQQFPDLREHLESLRIQIAQGWPPNGVQAIKKPRVRRLMTGQHGGRTMLGQGG